LRTEIAINIVEKKEPDKLTIKKNAFFTLQIFILRIQEELKNATKITQIGKQRTQICRFMIMSRVARLNKKKLVSHLTPT